MNKRDFIDALHQKDFEDDALAFRKKGSPYITVEKILFSFMVAAPIYQITHSKTALLVLGIIAFLVISILLNVPIAKYIVVALFSGLSSILITSLLSLLISSIALLIVIGLGLALLFFSLHISWLRYACLEKNYDKYLDD